MGGAKVMREYGPATKVRENRTGNPYRILLADDHAIVRHGLRAYLGSVSGVEVCGEATTGREAVDLAIKTKPDLVIIDLSMPEMNGLEAARAIRRKLRGTEVLVLTRHVSESIARLALRSGARGYVAKSDPYPEFNTALQSVREKRLYVTTQLARKLHDEFARIETGSSADLRLRPDPRVTSEQIIAALVRAEEKMRDEATEMVNSRSRHPKLP